MAKLTHPKSVQIGTRRNGSAVMSSNVVSPYYYSNGSKHGKPAMMVPVQFVTLPQNFYTHARKYLRLNHVNPNTGRQDVATYVIGNAFTQNGKKLYFVARLNYMGGKPAVAETHYRGYSKRQAWFVFNDLPFHEMRMNDNNGKAVAPVTSDGTYHDVIAKNQARRAQFNATRQTRQRRG